MTIDEMRNLFDAKYGKSYMKTLTDLSQDDNNETSLCRSEQVAYCYDAIVEDAFSGREDRPKSFDALSFQDGYINLIEFKNAVMNRPKTKLEVRLKVTEGILFLERVILNGVSLMDSGVPSRFVLVYSEDKNRKYLMGNSQMKLNQVLSFGSGYYPCPFIGHRFDKDIPLVKSVYSLSEIEFMEKIGHFM